jgi:hypothetical protein
MHLLLAVTALLGAIPVGAYGLARLTGSLPAEEEWSRLGGNHGPWWTAPQGWLIAVPWVLLLYLVIPATLVAGTYLTVASRKAIPIIWALILLALQGMMLAGQVWTLLWLVD